MSPANNQHGLVQARLVELLRRSLGGSAIVEASISTNPDLRVADVAWASDEFMRTHGQETPFMVAPEICIEVASPSNSAREANAIPNAKMPHVELAIPRLTVGQRVGRILYFICDTRGIRLSSRSGAGHTGGAAPARSRLQGCLRPVLASLAETDRNTTRLCLLQRYLRGLDHGLPFVHFADPELLRFGGAHRDGVHAQLNNPVLEIRGFGI